MFNLWSALKAGWLSARPPDRFAAPFNDHLRRDIGLPHGSIARRDAAPLPADPIRERNFSDVRVFCSLPTYR